MLRPLGAPGARLLDVGAGRARFVTSALAAGYDARGIEPSPRGMDEARLEDEVRLERVGIEQADVEEGTLDAVTIWHVLEHLDDPRRALLRMRGWVRPGGALLVGVPNLASAQALLGGARWYHLDVPRHRVHFTPAGIRSLLTASGFEPVRTHHVLAGLGDLFGDPEELQRRLGEFAEQMQGAQRLAWADNAIKLAVDLTVAAIQRSNIQGTTSEQAEQLRSVMAIVFPEAVTLVREAREGLQ